jgi:hypothetical protein
MDLRRKPQWGLYGDELQFDFSDLPPWRPLGKGPEAPASGTGDAQRDTDLAVERSGQMGDYLAQVLTVGQLPGARKGAHIEPMLTCLAVSPVAVRVPPRAREAYPSAS